MIPAITPEFLFRAVNVFDWEEMQLDGLLYDTYDSEQDKYSLIVYPHLGYALQRGEQEGEFHRLLAIPVEKYLPGGVGGLATLEAFGKSGKTVSHDLAIDLEQAVNVDDIVIPDSLNSLIAVCPRVTPEEIDLFYSHKK